MTSNGGHVMWKIHEVKDTGPAAGILTMHLTGTRAVIIRILTGILTGISIRIWMTFSMMTGISMTAIMMIMIQAAVGPDWQQGSRSLQSLR